MSVALGSAGHDMPDHPADPPPPIDDPARRRLPVLLRRAWYGMNQAFRRRIAHLGITPNQFTALRWLSEAGDHGITQRELADRMCSDANTIAALATHMAELGLVRRSVDRDDRRARRLTITAAGRRAYRAARPIAVDLQSSLLEALPPSHRERFLGDLERLADACREEHDPEPRASAVGRRTGG